MLLRFTAFLFIAIFFASLPGFGHPADSTILPCRKNAGEILDEAMGYMQKNFYRRNDISWTELTAQARARLNAASTCEDAYNTIGWCISQMHEAHSFLMPPARAALYNDDTASLGHAPALSQLVGEIRGEWLQDSIGYLTIPWVSTTDSIVCLRIADSLQGWIAKLDSRNITRWVIDLRRNTGGNCWPMLAGLGPLLGEGICGYFVSDNERIPISYKEGAACQGRHVLCRVSDQGYHMHCRQPAIVVLTGPRTVSAGEIVALAFKGREKVMLYGEPTAGLTTANATYTLSDHSLLVLTVCHEADHTGKVCEGRIFPDKYIGLPYSATAQTDPQLSGAVDWLKIQ